MYPDYLQHPKAFFLVAKLHSEHITRVYGRFNCKIECDITTPDRELERLRTRVKQRRQKTVAVCRAVAPCYGANCTPANIKMCDL
ncbi:hypothetical protein J6590_047291 [Homalodisca vitripennis]|nr:hypothetical protein J6590_047291 [Homalodisca vitripennis]